MHFTNWTDNANKRWAEGVSTGEFHDVGTKQGEKRPKHGKTPRVGIRKRRMARRRGA